LQDENSDTLLAESTY